MQPLPHDPAVDGVPITPQIPWCRVPRERLRHLSSNPLGRWVRRYGMVKEFPATVRKEHQAVQQLEANGRHDEHVGSSNPCRMIAQEGCPALAGSPGAL